LRVEEDARRDTVPPVMSDFIGETAAFAPQPGDSLRELRWKAESMLEYLRENETKLRKFPTGMVDERRALWQPLADLLARAMQNSNFADDARLEAHRVWAEELRRTALFIVTMCVHARTDSARQRFDADPETLEEFVETLETGRPAALQILSTEDMNELREHGFLRSGE
jgi:hypothetical protein